MQSALQLSPTPVLGALQGMRRLIPCKAPSTGVRRVFCPPLFKSGCGGEKSRFSSSHVGLHWADGADGKAGAHELKLWPLRLPNAVLRAHLGRHAPPDGQGLARRGAGQVGAHVALGGRHGRDLDGTLLGQATGPEQGSVSTITLGILRSGRRPHAPGERPSLPMQSAGGCNDDGVPRWRRVASSLNPQALQVDSALTLLA